MRITARVALGLFFLAAVADGAFAQTILTVTTASGFPLVEVDPATGVPTALFNTNFQGGVRFEVSAFDPIRRRLFCLGDISGAPQLITVNLNTSTTEVRPIPVTGSCLFIQYDASSGRLVAATTAQNTPIVAIDPETGNVQALLTTGFVGGVRFEVSAYDVAHRRLFFLGDAGGVPQLIIADLSSSNVTVRPIPSVGTYLFFEYDLVSDRIVAGTTAAGIPVVAINATTGAVLPVLTTGFTGDVRFEVSAFDALRRRLYFLGEHAGVPQLVSVNLQTMAVQVLPISTTGTYMFFKFAPSVAEIPVLQPLVLCGLAICVVAIAVLRSA